MLGTPRVLREYVAEQMKRSKNLVQKPHEHKERTERDRAALDEENSRSEDKKTRERIRIKHFRQAPFFVESVLGGTRAFGKRLMALDKNVFMRIEFVGDDIGKLVRKMFVLFFP